MADALVTFRDLQGRRWLANAKLSLASAAEAGQPPIDLVDEGEALGLVVVKFQFLKPVPAETQQ